MTSNLQPHWGTVPQISCSLVIKLSVSHKPRYLNLNKDPNDEPKDRLYISRSMCSTEGYRVNLIKEPNDWETSSVFYSLCFLWSMQLPLLLFHHVQNNCITLRHTCLFVWFHSPSSSSSLPPSLACLLAPSLIIALPLSEHLPPPPYRFTIESTLKHDKIKHLCAPLDRQVRGRINDATLL